MGKGRLEAFSDGVLAIIITIMVLELKAPHEAQPSALLPLLPAFLAYVLSFVYLGIYWSNHHHLFQAVHQVNGPTLWANLHLLFWLSLVPFVTNWAGESHFAAWPVAAYGVVLLMAGVAYRILVVALLRCHEPESQLARAIGSDFKGKISLVIYLVAIGAAFIEPHVAAGLFAVVAAIWIVPDRRIEKTLEPKADSIG